MLPLLVQTIDEKGEGLEIEGAPHTARKGKKTEPESS